MQLRTCERHWSHGATRWDSRPTPRAPWTRCGTGADRLWQMGAEIPGTRVAAALPPRRQCEVTAMSHPIKEMEGGGGGVMGRRYSARQQADDSLWGISQTLRPGQRRGGSWRLQNWRQLQVWPHLTVVWCKSSLTRRLQVHWCESASVRDRHRFRTRGGEAMDSSTQLHPPGARVPTQPQGSLTVRRPNFKRTVTDQGNETAFLRVCGFESQNKTVIIEDSAKCPCFQFLCIETIVWTTDLIKVRQP